MKATPACWYQARVQAVPEAVAFARRTVGELLSGWGLGENAILVDTAVLAASELLTNVVQHACERSPFADVVVILDDNRLTLHVHDRHPQLPHARGMPHGDGLRGRGLPLVAAMCAETGGDLLISPDDDRGGKTITVDLPVGPFGDAIDGPGTCEARPQGG